MAVTAVTASMANADFEYGTSQIRAMPYNCTRQLSRYNLLYYRPKIEACAWYLLFPCY